MECVKQKKERQKSCHTGVDKYLRPLTSDETETFENFSVKEKFRFFSVRFRFGFRCHFSSIPVFRETEKKNLSYIFLS